jgi:hypothetical protein
MSSPKVTVVVIADSYPKLAATLMGLGAAKGDVPFLTKVFAVNPSQALIKSNRLDMQVTFNGSKQVSDLDYGQAIVNMLQHCLNTDLLVLTWDGVKFADHWLEVLIEGLHENKTEARSPVPLLPSYDVQRSLIDEAMREQCWQITGERWGEGSLEAHKHDLECQNPVAISKAAMQREKPLFDDNFVKGISFGYELCGRPIRKVLASLFFI